MKHDLFKPVTDPFVVPHWPLPDHVRAIYTLRGKRATHLTNECDFGFNLGLNTPDDPMRVQQHRAQIAKHYHLQDIAWLAQVHGNHVVHAEQVIATRDRVVQADACIARTPNLACAVLTADCLPILVCHQEQPIVAAIHAGWRGLVNGVIEQTVLQICQNSDVSAANLQVFIGAAISQPCFEVQQTVMECFMRAAHVHDYMQTQACFIPHHAQHYFADLFELAMIRLRRLKIEQIVCEKTCTYSHPDLFYSYRREKETGRMAGLIWLVD